MWFKLAIDENFNNKHEKMTLLEIRNEVFKVFFEPLIEKGFFSSGVAYDRANHLVEMANHSSFEEILNQLIQANDSEPIRQQAIERRIDVLERDEHIFPDRVMAELDKATERTLGIVSAKRKASEFLLDLHRRGLWPEI